MNFLQIKMALMDETTKPDLIAPLIAGAVSILVAIISSILSYQLARKKSRYELEKLRTGKQLQLNLEIDKMQAEAFCQLHEPLKYIGKDANCPYAMFNAVKTDSNKFTVLNRSRGEAFLESINTYLFGPRGSLFLPRDLRNSLFALRGMVSDIIAEDSTNEIKLSNEKTIQRLDELISGENNIHKQLRVLMGTEDRKPINNLG